MMRSIVSHINIYERGLRLAMLFRIFKSSISLSVLATCAVFSTAAVAQSVPVFTPASNWAVGSTELSQVRGLKSMKLPCVVSAEYDNGFVVRFSGGGNEMLAMAVDFRQDVFVQGRKYDAMLSMGDNYAKQVTATAFTANTLIFNLRPLKDFYAAAKNAQTMEIAIDSNVMKFSLAKLSASYAQLEGCFAGENVAPAKPLMTAANTANKDTTMPAVAVPAVTATAMTEMPKSFDEIVQNADQGPQPSRIKQATPRASLAIPARISPATNDVPRATWNAKSGENIRAVLGRWANTAGYDLDWQAAQDSKVVQDISLNGSFEEAVSQLLAENSAVNGITGRVESVGGVKPLTSGTAANTATWNATAGSDLQSILRQWGARAGVSVVWKSSPDMYVKNAININGSFESAVSALLDQYRDDSNRPVGQLNVDPDTGARTLLIDVGHSG